MPQGPARQFHVEARCDGTAAPAFWLMSRLSCPVFLFTAMTEKDKPMKWDQIETKWAAMTRRIRADYASCEADRIVPTRRPARGVQGPDAATIAESMTAASNDPEFKSSAK